MYRNFIVLLLATTATVSNGSIIRSRGIELEGRITGGENTTIGDYPYTVSIRIANYHYCGGSIISNRVIVTAAHCVYPTIPANLHSVQYATSVIGGTKNVIPAERTLRNENYNTTNYNNDVGLLFLTSEIVFNAGANLISLASQAPARGVSAVITGWGFLSETGPLASRLQKAIVQIIDRSDCQQMYKGINKITLSMICAGVENGGIDACKWDSGGPLAVSGQLVGIISNGYRCGDPNYPGVYTNVAALKSWIEENMDS